MASRINRAIELLQQDQAIYYVGPHSGHVLTYEQGKKDAGTWADYINVGMEHGAFDMTGLAEYMRGLVDGGPTRSGHRTPAVIVEAPVNGIDEQHVRYNAWQFRQILGRGVHGILLCQAETPEATRAFVESCRYPHNLQGMDSGLPSPLERMNGATGTRGGRAPDGRLLLGVGTRGRGSEGTAAPVWGIAPQDYMNLLRSLAAEPARRAAAGGQTGKPRRHRALRGDLRRARPGVCRDGAGRPGPVAGPHRAAARPVFAGTAAGARPGAGGVPEERYRLPGGRHAGRTSSPA